MKRSAKRTASVATLALACVSLSDQLSPGSGSKASAQSALPPPSLGPDDCYSAEAIPGVSPRQYFEYCRTLAGAARTTGMTATAAAAQQVISAGVPVAQANFTGVPTWSNARIREEFRRTRDVRFMTAEEDPNFNRRNSWMFPDNGCFARSEMVASMSGDRGFPKPYKLFSFATVNNGLRVATSNHPTGFVNWNWHVVPIVKSANDGQYYVLDPAIDPTRPLQWQAWLYRQVSNLDMVRVVVGDSNAYDLYSFVTGGENRRDDAYDALHLLFLEQEWDRQEQLLRDPYVVLGEKPPWKREDQYFVGGDEFFSVVNSCVTCTSDATALTQRCFTNCP